MVKQDYELIGIWILGPPSIGRNVFTVSITSMLIESYCLNL